jgi:ATP-dependent protease ClpP protease subunit
MKKSMENKMLNKILLITLTSLCANASEELVELTTKNTVSIRTEINYSSVSKAETELQDLDRQRGNKTYPIYLVLDSPGGSIDAGNNFIEFAKTFNNVKTISMFSASMASAIVQSMPGERLVLSTSEMMFHRAKAQIQGQVETGELESELAHLKSIVRHMEQINADRIGISLLDYKAKVKDEWWIFGKDNIKEGTADRLVSIKCSDLLIRTVENVVLDIGFMEISGKISACPLLREVIISK